MTDKHVDPEWIANHGYQIDMYVSSMVEAAKNAINGPGVYNLEGGDFSITLTAAGTTYPIAAQFGFEDTDALKKEADEMVGKLTVTARRYAEADKANAKH